MRCLHHTKHVKILVVLVNVAFQRAQRRAAQTWVYMVERKTFYCPTARHNSLQPCDPSVNFMPPNSVTLKQSNKCAKESLASAGTVGVWESDKWDMLQLWLARQQISHSLSTGDAVALSPLNGHATTISHRAQRWWQADGRLDVHGI